ncbi:Glycosyl transferase family 90 protein, partial [Globisporangium splendens]
MDRPMLRGIFAFEDEETPEWRRVVLTDGVGGVPKFATKSECEAFIRKHCWRGSNPDYPMLQHVFSMLVDWKQIRDILIPKIEEYDQRYPAEPPAEISADNRFMHGEGIRVTEGVEYRVNLPFHRQTNRESTINTLKYLFFHMRCGIFVMIRRRRVVLFVPFANKDYENNWGDNIKFDSSDGSMHQYYREKQNYYRRENIIPDPRKWWANGNIICNEHCRYRNKQEETQYWGDQFLTQLRDMLEDACKHRNIADCEFFINKRDYPHLKNDWECFCEVKPGQKKRHGVEEPRDLFTASNFRKFYKPWEEKVNTAFFRGSATGGGTTIDTNQRLQLAHLSNTWKHDPKLNGEEAGDGVPLLNAEVTTWNLRDKKIAGKPMTFLRTEGLNFEGGRQHFIPIYEQSVFKYLLYVEGHCAANRYAFLMRLGSVILKVESRCVADKMWYYPILKPFEDHVPVKEDLSDLAEKIQWCRDNDDKCRQIAARANELYEQFISKEAIHDYMELICNQVAQRFQPAPTWYHRPLDVDAPKKPNFSRPRAMCTNGPNARLCKRCQELKAADESRGRSDDSHRSRGDRDRGYPRHRSDSYGDRNYGGRNDDRRGGGGYHNNNNNNRYGGSGNGGGDRYSRQDYRDRGYGGSNDRNRESSPNRQRATVVPSCRRCRRPKTACTCSFRR